MPEGHGGPTILGKRGASTGPWEILHATKIEKLRTPNGKTPHTNRPARITRRIQTPSKPPKSAAIRTARYDCPTRSTTESSEAGQGSVARNAASWLVANKRRPIPCRDSRNVDGGISQRSTQVWRRFAIDRLAGEDRIFAERTRKYEFADQVKNGGPLLSRKRFNCLSVRLERSGRGKV